MQQRKSAVVIQSIFIGRLRRRALSAQHSAARLVQGRATQRSIQRSIGRGSQELSRTDAAGLLPRASADDTARCQDESSQLKSSQVEPAGGQDSLPRLDSACEERTRQEAAASQPTMQQATNGKTTLTPLLPELAAAAGSLASQPAEQQARIVNPQSPPAVHPRCPPHAVGLKREESSAGSSGWSGGQLDGPPDGHPTSTSSSTRRPQCTHSQSHSQSGGRLCTARSKPVSPSALSLPHRPPSSLLSLHEHPSRSASTRCQWG